MSHEPPIEIPGSSEINQAEDIARAECNCEFDLSEQPCELCEATEGDCYFISDGCYDAREGNYFCWDCCVGRLAGIK